MGSDDDIVTHKHLMTVESFMAEIAKSQAQYALNQAQQTESLNLLTKAVNELVISEKVRVEADKQNSEKIDELIKFKKYANPIVDKAKESQSFWAGFTKNTVYVVTAAAIIGIMTFSGKLIYDNAGQKQKTEQVGK